ncbi:MAG: DNA polymerase III subunit gamma/tau [Candidatus Babeliales bacterium]
MNTVPVNLARKWRSKNFDEIIGQDLSVRMLKNSLYLNQFFPVYLFSGQRGCGKTSTARIFSAAINCQHLADFRQHPKTSPLPCLTCQSCQAMRAGRHPDFFEIDAASHTGVDHIRTIIDSATLLPIMGNKKIYLIDEAHMLSKASFNALLKILEEPPLSVVFILATTDAHKIIETVKSRCFQLLFKPIGSSSLVDHLTMLCATENIPYDVEGLKLIAQESEGSARDAINVLEQVRFSSTSVTKLSVLKVLGYIDDAQLIKLFAMVLTVAPAQLIAAFKKLHLESYAAPIIWNRFAELARTALWAKHGVASEQFVEHAAEIKRIVQSCSWLQLNDFLDQLYEHEAVFLKTTAQHALFEMILLQLCYKYNNGSDSAGPASVPQSATPITEEDVIVIDDDQVEDDDQDENEDEEEIIEDDYASQWVIFVSHVATLKDPLLLTLFKQGRVVQVDASTGAVSVEFPKDVAFFNDWMIENQNNWMPHLQGVFGTTATLIPLFNTTTSTKEEKAPAVIEVQKSAVTTPTPKPVQQRPAFEKQPFYQKRAAHLPSPSHGPTVDISDTKQFATAHMLLRYFPGTITEVRE